MRNSILAVLPRMRLSSVGSCRPGTCTRMRSVPCRWITGSTVPSWLTRRSTIWIDCSIVCRMRSVMAACGTVRRINPPPASLISRLRWPLEPSRPPSGCDRSRNFASAVCASAILDPHFDIIAARRKAGVTDLVFTQHATGVVAHLIELLFLDVVGIDLQQQIGAALQIETEHEVALGPNRPGLHGRSREEIRNGAQAHRQRRQDDRQRLSAA